MNGVGGIDHLLHRKDGDKKSQAFPKLEKLELDTLLNLEAWAGTEDGDFQIFLTVDSNIAPNLFLFNCFHTCVPSNTWRLLDV